MAPTSPQATPMPAFTPVDNPDEAALETTVIVAFTADEVALAGEVAFTELEDVVVVAELEDKVDAAELEDEVDELAVVKVEIVAPESPRVKTSVLPCTWKRPIPESQHPLV